MQTMGEFASLTERLALMADPALQQFAQMHKDDPFTLSLAVSESNRRRKLRTAQQGLAGMQQQAPVADQEIAQMAEPAMPETVGIGALPAPSMAGMPAGGIAGEEEPQAMAGGGMVAFSGGGDVERYQSAGFVQPQQRPGESFADFRRRAFQEALEYERATRQREFAESEAARQKILAERGGSAIPPSFYGIQRQSFTPTGLTPVATPTPTPSPSGPRNSPAIAFPPAAEQLRLSAEGQPIPMGDAVAAAAAAADTTQRQKPPAPGAKPAGAGPAADGGAGLPNVEAMMATALGQAADAPNPFAQKLKDVGEQKVRAKEIEVRGLEAIHKQFSDIFKGRKERLDTREAELGKMKDQGLGLALLQAGATMMSTPGGLSTALGKGVKVGADQYASGLEKLRGAQEKLLDARDRLEDIESQRNELSARELFKARSDIRNLGISVQEDLIKSNMQMYGVNRETAMKMVEQKVRVGISAYEQQQQTKRTGMSNAAQLEAARIAAAARTTGRDSEMEEYTKWLKENPQYMANPQAGIQAFLKAKAAISGFTNTTLTDKPAGRERE